MGFLACCLAALLARLIEAVPVVWVSHNKMVSVIHPAAVRCEMVLHQAFRARRVRKNGIGGEVRCGVTSGVSCETSLNKHVTPHLHREHISSTIRSGKYGGLTNDCP